MAKLFGYILFFIICVIIILMVFWQLSSSSEKEDEHMKNALNEDVAKALTICAGQKLCMIRLGIDVQGMYYSQTNFINAMNNVGYEFQSAGGRYSDYLYFKKKE